jgi:hypothetical protein
MNWLALLCSSLIIAGLPASSNFKLDSFGFGSGGTANSGSSNYRVNGTTGEQAGSTSSANYKLGAGEKFLKQAHVPIATISNGNDWYDRLKLVIDNQGNASDATFAVAISTDNFVTTQYVKSDFTIGSTLTTGDYLTYAAWGGAAGIMVRGLTPSTVYTVKAKAFHGAFTESDWGPTSSASTVDPYLIFDIDTAATDTETSPPYQVPFGDLVAGSVNTAPNRVWVDVTTNANSGAMVYDSGQNSGLRSTSAGYTIASLSGDLGAQAEGFGAQGLSATQSSGGPLSLTAPYNVSGTNIGIIPTRAYGVFQAPGPVYDGRGSLALMAKSKTLTPAAPDYAEIITMIAAGTY